MQKITPFLWFDNQVEEAIIFYVSIFKNAKVGKVARYGEAGPGPKGSVMTASFSLEGLEFTALNGGPHFKFNEAISFVVTCESQAEIDELWERLSESGGATSRCGWLKDKFGVSWQVVPSILVPMLTDPDAKKSQRVMETLLDMTKIDIQALRQAYEGELA
ncbi:VOC family protein [Kaistia sp. 32K]|uniref:VOC family protein n=1 Tax=Kaistia sp. 32K TaxID=2795690 RepID=UPI0019158C3C|nr:VOC family protein [Kaistia sp. 32K]BCP54267.1 VOC family protein [Kaistia sp. 32K]